MATLLLFNKPFRVLSQFSDSQGRTTLANYLSAPGFRAAGRLDYDSEGLLLLTDNGHLQQRIANPRHKQWKHYRVQVEGDINEDALNKLRRGLILKDGPTLPARAQRITAPAALWPRNPPIRQRQQLTDSWLELSIREGRNRQVRRMTAAVGFPTLRLIRWQIADWCLDQLAPGQYRQVTVNMPALTTDRGFNSAKARPTRANRRNRP
ncbi:MAG: pseudouridine synthase [Parahaliea sp.]